MDGNMKEYKKIYNVNLFKESINEIMDDIEAIDAKYSFSYTIEDNFMNLRCYYDGNMILHRYDTIDCIGSYLLGTLRVLKNTYKRLA